MDTIFSDFSFWICFAYFLKALKASLFCTRNKVQEYLEKSSTITKAYTLPPKLFVLDGPKRSMCNNCSGLIGDFINNQAFIFCKFDLEAFVTKLANAKKIVL